MRQRPGVAPFPPEIVTHVSGLKCYRYPRSHQDCPLAGEAGERRLGQLDLGAGAEVAGAGAAGEGEEAEEEREGRGGKFLCPVRHDGSLSGRSGAPDRPTESGDASSL